MGLGASWRLRALVPCGGALALAVAPTWTQAQSYASRSAEPVLERSAPSGETIRALRDALRAARSHEPAEARALSAGLGDPVARKLVLWAIAASTPGGILPPAPDGAAGGWAGWPALPRITRDPRSPAALWTQRRRNIIAALRAANYRLAYTLAAQSGLPSGPERAEAEFDAGWIALRKLHQAQTADEHFARIAAISSSPISQARAYYWRGRAAETASGSVTARAFYAEAARHRTTFYGQFAAERIGSPVIALGDDPVPSAEERDLFEDRELSRAVRLLLAAGEDALTPPFAAAAANALRSPGEYVLLIDLLRRHGRQFDSMTVARTAAQHGVILPQRAYPLRTAEASGAVNTAFLLALIRQESGFDPRAHSPAGARGMMQLLPSTARIVARARGLGFSPAELEQAGYNIRIGSAYLGQLVARFNGSYVMAAAGYNAGPLRLPEWVALCGDPRSPRTDPVDFIECIPVAETRNYVMRVMEGMQVYRAKLAGGEAAITLSRDLARGTPG